MKTSSLTLLGVVILLIMGYPLAQVEEHSTSSGQLRLELAKKWEQNGEISRAIQELRQHLAEHPEDVGTFQWLGDLRLQLGNDRQAIESYRAGLTLDPGRHFLREKLALALEKSGDVTGAQAEWQKIKEMTPNPIWQEKVKNQLAHFAKTELLQESQDSTKSSEEVAKEVKPSGIYALPEFLAAIQEYRAKQKEQALATIRKVLSKSPNHPGAYYLGGVIRYENGEFDKAIYNFNRSFDYPEKGFNAHFYLARIYQKQGKVSSAITAVEKYLKATQSESGRKQGQDLLAELKKVPNDIPKPTKDSTVKVKSSRDTLSVKSDSVKPPENAGPLIVEPARDLSALGYPIGGGLLFVLPDSKGPGHDRMEAAMARFKGNKIENALQILKAIQLEFAGSENAEAVPLNLAAIYIQMGLWDQAAAQLGDYLEKKAVGKLSRYARYLKALALVGQKKGKYAEDLLLKVRNEAGFGPPTEEIVYQLSRAAQSLGDTKGEAAYLGQAEAILKDSLRLYKIRNRLGQYWFDQGQGTKASEYYRKSLQVCRDSSVSRTCADPLLHLADIEFKLDPRQSKTSYLELIRRFPKHKEAAWAQYQIGNIYKSLGEWEEALHAYQKVIDNYPYSYWAAQAKWQKEDAVWRKEYGGVLN